MSTNALGDHLTHVTYSATFVEDILVGILMRAKSLCFRMAGSQTPFKAI